jgi:quinol-cytochrome oxidoreductase complex cytochrome b subunit
MLYLQTWYRLNWLLLDLLTGDWAVGRPTRLTLGAILKYAMLILVPYFRASSVFGFSLLLNMLTQMWSGLLLALYYVPDPSFVLTFREEYMNEVWWYFYVYKLHVVGVDTIFVLSYLHILKKIFIKNFVDGDVDG